MKIGFYNRGIYDSATEYDILDFVAADNTLYISRRSGNKGHDLSDTEWWQKSIHGSAGITEKELEDILFDYWKKSELTVIPTENIIALS